MVLRTSLVVRRERGNLPRRRWFEASELFIEVTVEADCVWISDTQEFKALLPMVVAHDGPEQLALTWDDLDARELRRAMRALQTEMERSTPFVLEEAA